MFFNKIKSTLQSLALRKGYEIRKAHPTAYKGVRNLDPFALALRELIGRKGDKITFVEIGANDGIDGDFLRPHIEALGMRGILVEPQPAVFERLRKNYEGIANVSFENCAISAVESELTLFCVEVGGQELEFASTLATSNRAAVESYALETNGKIVELKVPSITPRTLLAKHGFEQVDIIQIDTEGMDFEILKSFDLVTTAPEIIHYESGQMKPAEQEESYRYLSERGFQVITCLGDTLAIPAQ